MNNWVGAEYVFNGQPGLHALVNWALIPARPVLRGGYIKATLMSLTNQHRQRPGSGQSMVSGRGQNLSGAFIGNTSNGDAYMCPVDVLAGGKPGEYWSSRVNKLSTYIMNGGLLTILPIPPVVLLFWIQDLQGEPDLESLCIINWEPNAAPAPVGAGSFAYNDGSSYPDTWEGMGRLHIKGANLLSVGGNAVMWTFADYSAEVHHNAKGENTKGKVWCGESTAG